MVSWTRASTLWAAVLTWHGSQCKTDLWLESESLFDRP